MEKRILCPERLRNIPAQWSWVDQRLIRMNGISACDSKAWALYLFLITVSDRHGLSYYSDLTIREWLKMTQEDLMVARRNLLKSDLLVFRGGLYQVLSLPMTPSRMSDGIPAKSGLMSIHEVFASLKEVL